MSDANAPVRILFRADARPDLGGGHIMRCLSLADALDRRGCEIAFACCAGSAELVPALARSGFPFAATTSLTDCPMPAHWNAQADILFVDLYDSRLADEVEMRRVCHTLAVIEDLPVRKHDCDLLVDQGFDRRPATYHSRVPEHCQLLLGPDMVPLRDIFAVKRPQSLGRRRRTTHPQRVLIAMGLTDVREISARTYAVTRSALPDVEIDIVLGPHADSRAQLEDSARTDPLLNLHVDVEDMASLMAQADLAIGAGGGTALERCVLGLPSLVIILADNQRLSARAMEKAGACIALEDGEELASRLSACLNALDTSTLLNMSLAAATLCDGEGAHHIAQALVELHDKRRVAAS